MPSQKIGGRAANDVVRVSPSRNTRILIGMTRMGRDALLATMKRIVRIVRMTRWMAKYPRKEAAKIVGSEDLRGCWHIQGGEVEIKMRLGEGFRQGGKGDDFALEDIEGGGPLHWNTQQQSKRWQRNATPSCGVVLPLFKNQDNLIIIISHLAHCIAQAS